MEPEDPRLLLNTVVEKVIYDDAGVTVTTNKGHKIIADYAICTFSQVIKKSLQTLLTAQHGIVQSRCLAKQPGRVCAPIS